MATDNISHFEIELRYKVDSVEGLKTFLSENARLVSSNVNQKDSYFSPENKDFFAVDYPFEWLRVRKSEKGNFFAYKHFYPENSPINSHCEEHETKIDNYDALNTILLKLGFKLKLVVEKTRTTWIYENVEIVIDEVNGLGSFIELEAKGHFNSVDDANKCLYTFVDKIKHYLGVENQKGYANLLLDRLKADNLNN